MNQPALPEVPTETPVTLINVFTVPVAESDRFLELWEENARILSRYPGFIRARMHRSLVDEVEFRFVNIAEWESGKALSVAREDPGWQASVRRMMNHPQLHISARPSVYEVAVDVPSTAGRAV